MLEELYVERASQESYVGNIYKGKIVNLEPSIQAAFVDFGIGRNGFLHVSDVDPIYYKHLLPKHIVAEIEAEQDEAYGVSRGGQRRNDDRRGPRRERNGDAPPPRRTRHPLTNLTYLLPPPDGGDSERPSPVETFDDNGFGIGLVEVENFGGEMLPPPLPKAEAPKPAARDSPRAAAADPRPI